MSLLEHLDELRGRLLKAVIALVLGIVVGAFITEPVLHELIAPLGGLRPYAESPTAPPAALYKLSAGIGLSIARPVLMYP
ncbi:MAG: twin-arginine translocase subunit TatC, partial [Anaerolineales bacterium]